MSPDSLIAGGEIEPTVFGEFGFSKFSQAQRNASLAARYLASLIGETTGRKRYLVAHSLGSKDLMDALLGLPEPVGLHPVSGVLLVAGAIPATSVRECSSTIMIRVPAGGLWNLSARTQPIEDRGEGTGEYVGAASRAKHIVVTIASGSDVLGHVYRSSR